MPLGISLPLHASGLHPEFIDANAGLQNKKKPIYLKAYRFFMLRGLDLNQRPLGYEPSELPDCSTPRQRRIYNPGMGLCQRGFLGVSDRNSAILEECFGLV